MKNVKRILGVTLVLLVGLIMVGCKKDKKPVELTDKDIITAAHTQLALGLSSDEMKDLKNDFAITTKVNVSSNEVLVEWKSSNENALKVVDGMAKVRLQEELTDVVLTATLTFKEEKMEKTFEVTVSKVMQHDELIKDIHTLLSDKDNEGKIVRLESKVVVIAVGTGGYFLADETGAISVYDSKGTPAGIKVGDQGTIIGKLDVAFNTTPQFKVEESNFIKDEEKMPLEEIIKLAKERTLEEQTNVDPTKWEEAFGFYKVKAKLVNKTVNGNRNPHIVSIDNKFDFVHYYKIDGHDQFMAIADSGLTDEGVDMYMFINDYHSGDKVFRLGLVDIDVDLNSKAKAGIDATIVAKEVSTLFYENGDINLNGKPVYNSEISWKVSKEGIIDLKTGKVTVPAELEEITLTVTAKLDGETATQEIKIFVGLPKITSIKELQENKAEYAGKHIRVSGEISNVKFDDKFKNGTAVVTDESTGTISLFRFPEKYKNVIVNGAKLEIAGLGDLYKENPLQIKDIKYVKNVA